MPGRPLRTYQRKQKNSQPVITSTIVKAPIPIDPYTSSENDDDGNDDDDDDDLQNDIAKNTVNPFETTFDRIAKDVKTLRKKETKQTSKKNINKKIKKSTHEDKKIKKCNIELIRLENESSFISNKSIESSAAINSSTKNPSVKINSIKKKINSPQKRESNISKMSNKNKAVTLKEINKKNTNETSVLGDATNNVFPLLKNCFVNVVRLDTQKNLHDNSSLKNEENIDDSNKYLLPHDLTLSKVNTNSRIKLIKPKKCHVSLVRIDTTLKAVNKEIDIDDNHLNVDDNMTTNDQTFLSSTPLHNRMKKRQTRPKLSPINTNTNGNNKLDNLKNEKQAQSSFPLVIKERKKLKANKGKKTTLRDLISYDNNDVDEDVSTINLALKLARKSYDLSELKETSLYQKSPVKEIINRDNNINLAKRIITTPLSVSIDDARSPLLFDDSSYGDNNDQEPGSVLESSDSMESLRLPSSPDTKIISRNEQEIKDTSDVTKSQEIIQQDESKYEQNEDEEIENTTGTQNVDDDSEKEEQEKTESMHEIEDIETDMIEELEKGFDVTKKVAQSNETIDDKEYEESVTELIQSDVESDKERVTDVFINEEKNDEKQYQINEESNNDNDESLGLENTENLSYNNEITVDNTHDYSSEINNTDNLSAVPLESSQKQYQINEESDNDEDDESLGLENTENSSYNNENTVANTHDYSSEINNTDNLSAVPLESSQDYPNESDDVLSSMKNITNQSSALINSAGSLALNNTHPLSLTDHEYFSTTNNTQDLLSTNNSSDSIQSDSSQDLPIEYDETSSTSTVMNLRNSYSRMNDFDDLLKQSPVKTTDQSHDETFDKSFDENINDTTANESYNNIINLDNDEDDNNVSRLKKNTSKKLLIKKYNSFEEDDIIVSEVKNKKFIKIRNYSNEEIMELSKNKSKFNDESNHDNTMKDKTKKSPTKSPINSYAFDLGLNASNENIYDEVFEENNENTSELNKTKKSSIKINDKSAEKELKKNKKSIKFSVKINDTPNEEEINKNRNKSSIKLANVDVENNELNKSVDVKSLNKLNNTTSEKLPIVLLERLNDSVRISNRKRDNPRNKKSVYFKMPEEDEDKIDNVNDIVSIEEVQEIDQDNDDNDCKVLYLKPGKQWARSLSILNQINNKKQDINKMGFGKGKKWRQSVVDVYNMQNEHRMSTIKKSADDIFTSRKMIESLNEDDEDDEEDDVDDDDDDNNTKCLPDSSNKYKKLSTLNKRKTSVILQPRRTTIYNPRVTNIDTNTIIPNSPRKAREIVFKRCQQDDFIPISTCYTDNYIKNCRKIGEGVYGEVFIYNNKNDTSVIKIIPIEGNKLVNGEPQKKYNEILSEIIIAEELHKLRFNDNYKTSGFCEVKSIKCLIGKYPNKLIDLWNKYDEEKTSENDCPSMFTDEQLYISLELGNGGQDLEAFIFQNATEALSVFIQIALTLAVGEKSLNFEHRDMHWGNILISKTKETIMYYKFDDEEFQYSCQGIKVSIIDFTLSRITHKGCSMYNDLSLDPSLFTAVGEYQFDVYRLMKAKLENDWKRYEPSTNILWLHYTLDKMLTAVRYKKSTTKVHKKAIEKIQQLKDQILNYESSYHFITEYNLMGLKRFHV
ncbi:MATH and LRR domain-containing protein PFE0570w [Aphidius gifuensis]|uniref:MATH and LRR domain-containing protein PFE0570w n=1 Tax=Aphidius gifuensis TaxID=684658 RepID=UPI001CDCE820|nr:MATH and LRR domain-containing protein PFE0570w [Aphidius gifuensis]